MHKRFSLENSVFFRFISSLMVFWLSVSAVWSQDSIKNPSPTVEIYITNNSFHVVGEAKILGNVRTVKIKTDKQAGKAKELIAENKSKDRLRISKSKRIKPILATHKSREFFLPSHNSQNFTYKSSGSLVYVTSNDTHKFLKIDPALTQHQFCFKTRFQEKEVFTIQVNYSNSYRLIFYQDCIEARPPPDWV